MIFFWIFHAYIVVSVVIKDFNNKQKNIMRTIFWEIFIYIRMEIQSMTILSI